MWSRRPGSCCLSVDRGFGLGQSVVVMVARWVSWGCVLVIGCAWWWWTGVSHDFVRVEGDFFIREEGDGVGGTGEDC